MPRVRHWQDPVSAFLGAWLVLSPWILGFADDQHLMITSCGQGVLLVAARSVPILVPKAWEEWIEVALGTWLVASPWIWALPPQLLAMQSAVFTGVLVVVMALWCWPPTGVPWAGGAA